MKPLDLTDAEAKLAAAWLKGDDVTALHWEAWVQAHDPAREPRTASLAGAALWYAEQGLHVFPLVAGSKHPFPRSHGCLDATADVQQVRTWWTAAPGSNIGIATGHLVNVIDIDGPVGNESLAAALADNEALLDAMIGQVLTPRAGGRHLYMPAASVDLGNRTSLAPGVDYRGRGGYVVAPPSSTGQGTYRWLQPLRLP